MAMTRVKFLALCAGKKNNKGFNVYRQKVNGPRNSVAYRVRLDPGVGFPGAHVVLYTTADLAKSVDAENRFNMWLIQEGLHSNKNPAGGAHE